MNNEEKILAILEKHGAMLETLTSDMSGMKADMSGMKADMSGMKAEMGEMKATQAKMQAAQAQMQAAQAKMQAAQAQMQDDLTCVRLRLELDVEKRFDAVNEGIDAILEKMAPQSRVEALEDDVIVLKTAFKALAQEVAELKKAQ